MNKRKRIALLAALGVFLALFAARFAWELARPQSEPSPPRFSANQAQSNESPSSFRKNYASEKVQVGPAASQQVDQKYERVADIVSRSDGFERDAKRLREIAAGANAVVQRENAWGLPGSRNLSLALGVLPAAFDPAVEAIRAVGKLRSVTVTKTDRTGDFKALEARRLSLEKTRDGLRALRTGGAQLSDLVALETKILEIEGQIQELGVSLGDFSETNSFCTVNVSLAEAQGVSSSGRILRAAVEAAQWSLLMELGACAVALAAAAAAALAAWAWRKFAGAGGAGAPPA